MAPWHEPGAAKRDMHPLIRNGGQDGGHPLDFAGPGQGCLESGFEGGERQIRRRSARTESSPLCLRDAGAGSDVTASRNASTSHPAGCGGITHDERSGLEGVYALDTSCLRISAKLVSHRKFADSHGSLTLWWNADRAGNHRNSRYPEQSRGGHRSDHKCQCRSFDGCSASSLRSRGPSPLTSTSP